MKIKRDNLWKSTNLSKKICAATGILVCLTVPSLNCAVWAEANAEGAPDFSGTADYYADCFHGKRTASGQLHDKTRLTAAHRTLPFGTKLKLINHRTKKSCIVTINDRGPFTKGRIIDVSKEAAHKLGIISGSKTVDCYIVDSRTAAEE